VCLRQLVELNEHIEELEAQNIEVYGISPSPPEAHQAVMEEHDLQFELLTDYDDQQFGIALGFIDLDEQLIYRGYVAANPETENMIVEVDYLVGENKDEVLQIMEDI
jgi:peroxiredoxin